MWSHLILLLIVGVAVGRSYSDHEHAWDADNVYKYAINSQTKTNMINSNQPAYGIAMKGVLVVHAQTPDKLQATVPKLQYVRVDEQTSQDHETGYSQQQHEEYHDVPISGKPFEITLKHGVMRDVKVDKNVPVWEVNLLKSILSQLQVDTQGENRIKSRSDQIPDNEQQPFASYKVIEDSVGGNCEVHYYITPMSQALLDNRPELVPLPHLDENNNFIEIKKTKDYQRCKQRQGYHYNQPNWPITWQRNQEHYFTRMSPNDKPISHVSTNHMVIAGNLKRFTIQSSVTTSNIFVKLGEKDSAIGSVDSKVNLTLVEKNKSKFTQQELSADQHVSTGNLVYMYNNPFSKSAEVQQRLPSISRNSQQAQSSESQSSSEQGRQSARSALLNDQRDDGSSSSSSYSSEENDDKTYLQSPPSLDEAPHNPLLPFFIGYNGKNIQTSDQIDAVQTAANLAIQITEGMENPNAQKPGQTLERFTILQNLLRTMNTNQLAEVENAAFKLSKLKNIAKKVKNVLQKTIIQIGTGPALEVIKQVIKNKSIKGFEAAMSISRIPKTVRTPTEEYIREFYKLISTPEVTNQNFLNVSAPLALAEMIRNVQYDKRHYPVESFGSMRPPNSVLEELISYFAQQLQEAIRENNSPRIQTYILALCSTGHPKAISVAESYLEGNQGLTKFQRLMMVNSLSPLARDYPKLVRPVVFKLYSDIHEPDDIRVAAFYTLIKTNPPLPLMMHIARQTHHDKNYQVNSAVTTTINSLAKLNQWQAQDMAVKARMVRNLLNNRNPNFRRVVGDYKKSVGYYADSINDNFVQRYYVETIGGNRYLPKYAHMKVDTKNDNFGSSTLDVEYALSSIQQLAKYYFQNVMGKQQEGHRGTLVEKIARALNMKPYHVEQLEGYLLSATPYETQLYPFDENVLQNLLTNWNNQENQLDMNLLYNRDKIISFPTESGLPFTYTVKKPILSQIEPRNTGAEINKNSKTVKSAINILFASRSQNRFGFVTPFEHQQYIAGIDRDFHVQLPLEFKGEQQHTGDQTNLELKLIPQSNQQTQKLMHASTVPFVMRHDILDLQPLSQNRNMQKVMLANAQQGASQEGVSQEGASQEGASYQGASYQGASHQGASHQGVSQQKGSHHSASFEAGIFRVVTESGTERNNNNFIRLLAAPSEGEDVHYRKIDVFVDSNAANIGIRLNVAHVQSNTDNAANQQSGSQTSETFTVTDGKPNSKERREQFLTELRKSNQPANNHVWDIDVEYPTLQKQHHAVFTFGVGHNKVDERYHILFYSNVQLAQNGNVDYEALGTGTVKFSQRTPLNFVRTINREPQNNFEFLVQYGKNLKNAEKVHVHANMMQSNNLKNMIKNCGTVKQCENEITQGNKGLYACQKATQLAHMHDQMKLSMRVESEQRDRVIDEILDYVGNMFKGIVESIHRRNNGKDTVDMEARTLPDRDEVDVSVSGPDMELTLSLFGLSDTQSQLQLSPIVPRQLSNLSSQTVSRLPAWLRNLIVQWISRSSPVALQELLSRLSSSPKSVSQIVSEWIQDFSSKIASGLPSQSITPRFLSLQKQVEYVLQRAEYQATCYVDKNQIVTFDRKPYPLQATEDWQVVLIPNFQYEAEQELSSAFIPEDMKVAILTREKDGSKQIRFVFNEKEVQVQKLNDDIQVLIDESQVKLYKNQDKPDKNILQEQQNGEVYVQIYELPDKSIRIQSAKYGVNAVYDGERIQIQVEDRYRHSIHGLCGTYDSQSDNDFASPENCIAQKPEDFSAMYTLTENGKQEYTAKNKNRQYQCVQQSHYQRNVKNTDRSSVSDINNWGYHYNTKGKKYGAGVQNNQDRTALVYHTIVEEEVNQICFSVRPVPSCDQHSRSTETKSKTYGLYCAPKDEATEQLKNRIKQGANPDLSHKPVSTKKIYEVPLACQAA